MLAHPWRHLYRGASAAVPSSSGTGLQRNYTEGLLISHLDGPKFQCFLNVCLDYGSGSHFLSEKNVLPLENTPTGVNPSNSMP